MVSIALAMSLAIGQYNDCGVRETGCGQYGQRMLPAWRVSLKLVIQLEKHLSPTTWVHGWRRMGQIPLQSSEEGQNSSWRIQQTSPSLKVLAYW